jgi:hypothetical protein
MKAEDPLYRKLSENQMKHAYRRLRETGEIRNSTIFGDLPARSSIIIIILANGALSWAHLD